MTDRDDGNLISFPRLVEEPVPGDDLVRVWVHERPDGVRFVHPDTVYELLRKMMKGSAAGTFCDSFELVLRRMIDEAGKP